MQESEKRIEEQPSAHKAKMRRWIAATIGIVLLILSINFMMHIFSKTSSAKKAIDDEKNKVAATSTDSPVNKSSFDDLLKSRSRNEKRVIENDLPFVPPKGFEGEKRVAQKPNATNVLSSEAKMLAQWKEQEVLRALKSRKGNWDYSVNYKSQTTTNNPTLTNQSRSTNGSINTSNQEIESLQKKLNEPMPTTGNITEKRAEVRKRIEMASKLRALIAKGDSNNSAAQKKIELNTISSQFDPPPPDIAGYTKENAYNADIEGKLLLPVGTEIPAQFMRKANSDINTSQIKGIVSRDVYDISKQYVLIPKGSEIIMKVVKASTVNEVIQNRMGMTVQWLVLPNGKKIDLSKSVGLDREGMGAIKDQVDYHILVQFLGVAAYAIVGSSSSYSGSGQSEGSFGGDVGQEGRQRASSFAQKYLNIVPTIIIRPGQSFYVALDDELYIEPWKNIYENYY